MLVVSHNLCFELQRLFIYVNMQMMLTLTVRFNRNWIALRNVQCSMFPLVFPFSRAVHCVSCTVCTWSWFFVLQFIVISTLFPSPFALCTTSYVRCAYSNFWRHFFDGMQLNECLLSLRTKYRNKTEHIKSMTTGMDDGKKGQQMNF